MRCTRWFENRARAAGARAIAGVDEVGRGALFGPVVAAAVILDPDFSIRGLNDSKQIPAPERAHLDAAIRAKALAWAVAAVDAGRIDLINIYQASRCAMLAAVEALAVAPDYLLVDAVRLDWPGPQEALIKGDARSASIAAASIVAKVHRDTLMLRWDQVFPAYNLKSNKGYSTPDHLAALRRHGPTPLHRLSYAPVSLAAGHLPDEAPLLPFPEEN